MKKIGKINENWIKVTKDNEHELQVGKYVRQPLLGYGEIVGIRDDRLIVRIKFDDYPEPKDIRVDVANLDMEEKQEPINQKEIKWFQKGKLEKMNNLKNYNTYVKEEYMYRHKVETKENRYAKQKEYFINCLLHLGCEIDKEELEKMDLGDLGRLLNITKKANKKLAR